MENDSLWRPDSALVDHLDNPLFTGSTVTIKTGVKLHCLGMLVAPFPFKRNISNATG